MTTTPKNAENLLALAPDASPTHLVSLVKSLIILALMSFSFWGQSLMRLLKQLIEDVISSQCLLVVSRSTTAVTISAFSFSTKELNNGPDQREMQFFWIYYQCNCVLCLILTTRLNEVYKSPCRNFWRWLKMAISHITGTFQRLLQLELCI